MPPRILGLSAYYHDSAACLVDDGVVRGAVQEERLSRVKHDARYPWRAIAWCLAEAGLARASDLDHVVFYDKPVLKFDRLLETYATFAPRGFGAFRRAMPVWLRRKLWLGEVLRDELGYAGEILFAEHHESHAASAFFPSPFAEAAILTIDGVGEWATASVGRGAGNRIELLHELRFPHSLGLLYSAFTAFCGFKVNDGEYKLMGLAPYGTPRYADTILEHLVDLRDDGSLHLDQRFFDYCAGQRTTNERFDALFGGPARRPEGPLTPREMDLAASIQRVTEEAMLRMARFAQRETGCENLVLAGGVALNCVGNGRILREGPFASVWIQPAAGDAGGALGAALLVHYQGLDRPRVVDGGRDLQRGTRLGPSFDDAAVTRFVEEKRLPATRLGDAARVARTAELLAAGKVVGWFEGPLEFGPRALGARSILGDARDPAMQRTLNLKIKFRESFRPFAPAVLAERAAQWFDLRHESPYMLLVAPVAAARRRAVDDAALTGLDKLKAVRSEIPAVTHVDGSARVQTVTSADDPLFHALLSEFERRTGCPVLVNTSFNVKDEPIVCSPADAYRCFLRTDMDALVLGPYVLEKSPGVRFPEPDPPPPQGDPQGEDDSPREAARAPAQARTFTLVLAALLALAAATSWWKHHAEPAGGVTTRTVALAALALLAVASAFVPRLARRLHRLAMAVAGRIAPVVNTVLLGLFFFGVLTPTAFLLRLTGKRPLDLGLRDGRTSYWTRRTSPAPSMERLRRLW